ncbi:MAG: Sulfotransferase domain [Phormidium sp. OSCR]|nr:MAG: Sulfotransferase domain [Phormidium sp. OSCR]
MNNKQDILPNFLGIGAQRSGTTWLDAMLRSHPQIGMPRDTKELMFFDCKYKSLDIKAYQSFFNGCSYSIHKSIGEITPGYLWTSPFNSGIYEFNEDRVNIPQRVHNDLGSDVKLLVVLRDPVKRAISAYLHHLSKNRINVKDSILDIGKRFGILHMGFYSKHLFHWMKHYPTDCFDISIHENILEDREGYLKRTFDFLGVAKNYEVVGINKNYGKRLPYKKTDDGILVNQNKQDYLVVKSDEIKILKDIYMKEIEDLETMFDLDVSKWK